MKKSYLTVIFLIFVSYSWAQKFDIQSQFFWQPFHSSNENAKDGFGFNMNYLHEIHPKIKLLGGIGFQINPISSHFLIELGSNFRFYEKKKISFSLHTSIGNGLALFSPKPLYSLNAKGLFFVNYETKKNNFWSLGTGFQYFTTPKYEYYSTIYQFSNFPLVLKFSF